MGVLVISQTLVKVTRASNELNPWMKSRYISLEEIIPAFTRMEDIPYAFEKT